MDVLCERCAGLDVSKRDAKVCVRVTGPGGKVTVETTTWTSMTNQVRELAQYLLANTSNWSLSRPRAITGASSISCSRMPG